MKPLGVQVVLFTLVAPYCWGALDLNCEKIPWGRDNSLGMGYSSGNGSTLYKPKLYQKSVEADPWGREPDDTVYDPATGSAKKRSSSIKTREDNKREEESRKEFYQQEREQLVLSYQNIHFDKILKIFSTDLGIFREISDLHGFVPEEKLEQCKKSAILVRKLQKQNADIQNLIKENVNCDKLYAAMKQIETGVERATKQNNELKLYFQQLWEEMVVAEQYRQMEMMEDARRRRMEKEEAELRLSLELQIHYAQDHALCNNKARTCETIWIQPWGEEWYISFLESSDPEDKKIYLVASESEIQEFAPKAIDTILKKLNKTLQYLRSHNQQDLKKTSLFVWNVKCVVYTPQKGHTVTRTDKVTTSNKNSDTRKADAKDMETGEAILHEDIDEKTIETETKYCYEVYIVDQKASNDIQTGLNFCVSCNGGIFSFWIETPHGYKLFEKEAPLFGKQSKPLNYDTMKLIRNDPVAMLTALSMIPEMIGKFAKANSSKEDLEAFLNQD